MSRRVKDRVNLERVKTGVDTAFEYFLIRLIRLLDVEIKITSEKPNRIKALDFESVRFFIPLWDVVIIKMNWTN